MNPKRFWRSAAISVFILIAAFSAACARIEQAPISTLPQLDNSMPGGRLALPPREIDGGKLCFFSSYSTAYDTRNWRVTDSKSVNLHATIRPCTQENLKYAAIVEHVHIDAGLKSQYAALDGWSQDSADFKLHTGNLVGVSFSSNYPYENIFAIEGFSQTLISGWGYFAGSYGYETVEQKRLTEDNLVKEGHVYANKFEIVWFLLIKYEGEENYHSASVVDEFLIPVANAKELLLATPTPAK